MSEQGPVTRGCRPSRYVRHETDNAESEVARLANLERYILRARAGLPLFDEPPANRAPSPNIDLKSFRDFRP